MDRRYCETGTGDIREGPGVREQRPCEWDLGLRGADADRWQGGDDRDGRLGLRLFRWQGMDTRDGLRVCAGVRHVRCLPGHQRSEEHTSELQSRLHLVCRLLLEKQN